jgi:hypothetical protein
MCHVISTDLEAHARRVVVVVVVVVVLAIAVVVVAARGVARRARAERVRLARVALLEVGDHELWRADRRARHHTVRFAVAGNGQAGAPSRGAVRFTRRPAAGGQGRQARHHAARFVSHAPTRPL